LQPVDAGLKLLDFTLLVSQSLCFGYATIALKFHLINPAPKGCLTNFQLTADASEFEALTQNHAGSFALEFSAKGSSCSHLDSLL